MRETRSTYKILVGNLGDGTQKILGKKSIRLGTTLSDLVGCQWIF